MRWSTHTHVQGRIHNVEREGWRVHGRKEDCDKILMARFVAQPNPGPQIPFPFAPLCLLCVSFILLTPQLLLDIANIKKRDSFLRSCSYLSNSFFCFYNIYVYRLKLGKDCFPTCLMLFLQTINTFFSPFVIILPANPDHHFYIIS